jgi:hypothetical protein
LGIFQISDSKTFDTGASRWIYRDPNDRAERHTTPNLIVSARDLSRIFDRFFCMDPSRGKQDGTGRGLATAKWIDDPYRAKITA